LLLQQQRLLLLQPWAECSLQRIDDDGSSGKLSLHIGRQQDEHMDGSGKKIDWPF
jgi:hypothetical protein